MAQNPLTINSNDDGKLSLEFSKEKLSEFVFSLLSTPRMEQRLYKGGFDLTLLELKSLIDKLTHKINTDHDVAYREFTADITLDNEKKLYLSTYDQLFSVSDYRSEEVKIVTATITVLIPFNRPNEEKSLEKQTIVISARSGRVGRAYAVIRSTEFTWPEGYFSIIDKHFDKLKAEVRSNAGGVWNYVFFLHPLMVRDDSDDDDSIFSASLSRMIIISLLCCMITFMIAFLGAIPKIKMYTHMYNDETELIENVDVEGLIDDFGWREAASMMSHSRVISESGEIAYSPEYKSFGIISEVFFLYVNSIIFYYFLFFATIVFSNYCYAMKISVDMIGRIFIFSENIPPRPKGNLIPGVLLSLVLGVSGSLMATGISGLMY